jgi:hypothetical protein
VLTRRKIIAIIRYQKKGEMKMKKYRIVISTEYIVDANTEEEAKDMVDYSYEVDSYYESIEEISEEE